MWNRTYYAVETRHPVKGSQWDGQHTFRVSIYEGPDGPSFYASSDSFGCGKNYATPEGAIRALVQDNGAEVLRHEYMYEDEI